MDCSFATYRIGIGHRRDDQGIGDGEHGRTVDDDEVDDLALIGEQLPHRLGLQELGRLLGDPAARHDPEVVDLAAAKGLPGPAVAFQHLGQPALRGREPEEFVQPRTAEIGRDQHDPLVRLRQNHRQVGGGRRLALARDRRDNHQGLVPVVGSGHEDARAKGSIRLGGRAPRGLQRHEERLVAVTPGRDRRDHRDDPRADDLFRPAACERVVHPFADEGRDEPDERPEDRREGDIQQQVRAGRPGRHDGIDQDGARIDRTGLDLRELRFQLRTSSSVAGASQLSDLVADRLCLRIDLILGALLRVVEVRCLANASAPSCATLGSVC